MAHTEITPDYGTAEKTLSIYTTGIIACILLTIIPFVAVMKSEFFNGYVVPIVFISAVVQFLVQVKCFLRLNYTTEQAKLNVLSFVFCLVLLLIVVIGSLWIMYNLNYNMAH